MFKSIFLWNILLLNYALLCWFISLESLMIWRKHLCSPTQLFSVKYCEILRHYVQTAASGSKTKFVQSLQTSRVSESATFSSTAETGLLLCKFLEELHFWVTTVEINQTIFLVIFIFHKSYVLKVILLVILLNKIH